MNIGQLVELVMRNRTAFRLVNNPLAQFGTPSRQYLGASLLPERQVPENAYTEENIQYRTVVANDGTRYSPVQKKASTITGSMDVRLAHSDIGSLFTSQDYDALIRLLERLGGASGGDTRRMTMEATVRVLNWVDQTLLRPLLEKNEKYRWEALVDAQVIRTGDNNFREVVGYPNPAGHRVVAANSWSDNLVDPYEDIMAMVQMLANKGYTVNRIIASTPVVSILTLNEKMRQRLGWISVAAGGVTGLAGRADLSSINTMLGRDGVPAIEKYDLVYRTQTGWDHFLKRDVMVFLATTGRDASIERGDAEPLQIENTLGYTGIGRPAGQAVPGRVIRMEAFENKPPRIEGEGWQTSLPVIMDPEAVAVITGID